MDRVEWRVETGVNGCGEGEGEEAGGRWCVRSGIECQCVLGCDCYVWMMVIWVVYWCGEEEECGCAVVDEWEFFVDSPRISYFTPG